MGRLSDPLKSIPPKSEVERALKRSRQRTAALEYLFQVASEVEQKLGGEPTVENMEPARCA